MIRKPRVVAVLVVVAWAVALAVAGPFAARLSAVQQNDPSTFLPAAAESTQVTRLQADFQGASSIPVVVVYERAAGITDADRAYVAQQANAVASTDGLVGAVSPLIASEDGKALEFFAELNSQDFLRLGDEVDQVRAQVRAADGLNAYVTGPAALAADFGSAFKGLDVKLLIGTGVVVVVILLLVYRSPVLWIVPVGVVGAGLFVAQALVYLAATRFGLQSNGQSQGILTILVFGAGTDYALLLTSRYREELRRQASSVAAVVAAWRGAAPAIVASGTTVVLSLLILLLSQQGANRTLGGSSAIGVAVVMVAMLTLMPAILALGGRRLFWPLTPRAGEASAQLARPGLWDRVASAVGRRPRAVWLAATSVLVIMVAGLSNLAAGGLPADRQYTTPLDSVAGQKVADRHFAKSAGSPLYVVTAAATQGEVTARLESLAGVAGVTAIGTSRTPGGTAKVVDGRVMLQVDTALAPDSAAAEDLVGRARAEVQTIDGARALVGGAAATNLDQRLASERDNVVIIPLVLAVILGVLLVLLRGVVASLLLIATVVLSFGATLGVSAFVFAHLFHFAGEDASWPLTTFVFLVALGIDYNIFLMTRVREETRRVGTRAGIVAGLARTGGVITSAGIVLAATFAVFTALPLVVLVEVGFAIAVGVLLDTVIVRTLLVPGLMHDLGDVIWWPGRLGRSDRTVSTAPEMTAPGERLAS